MAAYTLLRWVTDSDGNTTALCKDEVGNLYEGVQKNPLEKIEVWIQEYGKSFPYYEGSNGRYYWHSKTVKDIPPGETPYDWFKAENRFLSKPEFGLKPHSA